ncbi:MAG: hypothetical protein CSA62_15105 [Planctomycetota bacterium]|nr:MAG: hypothetical protein CSA62_15105 [Planctomycetota bacterium]
MRLHIPPPRIGGVLSLLFVFAVTVIVSQDASAAPIQTTSSSPLFVYVDPIYGDDNQAVAQNPVNPAVNPIQTSPPYPHPHRGPLFAQHTDPTQVSGYLQHAPYSFKTVGAALSYIQQFYPNGTLYSNPTTSVQLSAIVIHCLPGLYGPKNPKGAVDPASGLPWNGESFPLDIPDHVSIQGTSALDTIFDARGQAQHIFRMLPHPAKVGVGQSAGSHVLSFIDGITIRNAHGESAPQGAGIFVSCWNSSKRKWVNMRPKISNCFFTGNFVGIAVHAGYDDDSNTGPSGPVIFNNTFAWNGVGIWNGELGLPVNKQSYGWAKLCVFNNLFDATPYAVQPTTGGSAFEGVHGDDLLAAQATTPMSYQCFNAWEYYAQSPTGWGRANLGVVVAAGFPATGLRSGVTQGPLTPAHGMTNISSITGAGLTPRPRGILYISELLEARVQQSVSPHDFRLSPMVGTDRSGVSMMNPVVDRGTFAIPNGLFQNGISTGDLGLPASLAGTAASYLGSDLDAEGFGNPRSAQHNAYTLQQPSKPDLGADELDNLIMAGFIPSTRIFSRCVPGMPTPKPNYTSVLFVNMPNGSYLRPIYNYSFSEGQQTNPHSQLDLNWFVQAANNPMAGAPNNYTNGTGLDRLLRTIPPLQGETRPEFMRNLRCDFSPHPLFDPHPLWPEAIRNRLSSSNPLDQYACNPWVRDARRLLPNNMLNPTLDNEYLYFVPGQTPPNVAGHLNPPGTYFNDPTVWGNSLLWADWPTALFGPWGGGGNPNFTTDSWGVGDIDGVDTVPERPFWNGVRYNNQVYFGPHGNPAVPQMSNLQTFLGVNGPGCGAASGKSSPTPLSRAAKLKYVAPKVKLKMSDLSELVKGKPWWQKRK